MVKMSSPFCVVVCIYILTLQSSFVNSIMIHFVVLQKTQHKWAWPFMEPVDVEGLNLHDYYEVRPFLCFKAFLSVYPIFIFYLLPHIHEKSLLKKGLNIDMVSVQQVVTVISLIDHLSFITIIFLLLVFDYISKTNLLNLLPLGY